MNRPACDGGRPATSLVNVADPHTRPAI